jgi:hypothetical protein
MKEPVDMTIKTHDPDSGNAVHLTAEEARSGATPHMTRVILPWSLGLVIVAFIAVVAYYLLHG